MDGNIPRYGQTQPSNQQPFSSAAPAHLQMRNVTNAGDSLYLSADEQDSMARSVQQIFDLQWGPVKEDVEMDGEEDEDPHVDLGDQQLRTEMLKGVMPTLAQLWLSDSDRIDTVTEKLADSSRDPRWRIPLGDSGVLNFFLQILNAHSLALKHTLKIHIMRLVGNACADTDENRARVVASNYLHSIIIQLRDTSLLPFAIPVLYNICIDYEPAQLQASNLSLSRELIELISSPRFSNSRAFLGYICKILELLITQPSEPDLAHDNTAIILLKMAADKDFPPDMEDLIVLVNTAVAYLQHLRFQKALVEQGALEAALAVLVDSYTRFGSHQTLGDYPPDQDDIKVLSQMRSNLNQVLSDVSALPEFSQAYPILSPFSSSLRRWISSPQLQLQVCACIMMGNLARSDAACVEFVHTCQVHKPLIAVLNSNHDSQLLHAALGFLKNLALPPKNKDVLGSDGLCEALPRLWLLENLPQIQLASISLARQLIIGNFANVGRVCARLSDDEDSPAFMRSNLSLLSAFFGRTDVEPIKVEIARLITAICRVFHTYKGLNPEEMTRIRERFFLMHPNIGRPLCFMVSQTKWPMVRSEGLFVLALMAQHENGAEVVSSMLEGPAVFQPLLEMLTGRSIIDDRLISIPAAEESRSTIESSPAQDFGIEGLLAEPVKADAKTAEMVRVDRENALVLVSLLLKNTSSGMPSIRRAIFEDLLKLGAEAALSYQKEAASTENLGPEPGPGDTLSPPEIVRQSSSRGF